MQIVTIILLVMAAVCQAATTSTCTPVPSPSSIYHCATVGSLRYPPSPTPSPYAVNSVNDCAELCNPMPNCVSFGFNRNSLSCTLYSLVLTRMGLYSNKSSPAIYYNKKCFNCNTFCLPPTSTVTKRSTITKTVTTTRQSTYTARITTTRTSTASTETTTETSYSYDVSYETTTTTTTIVSCTPTDASTSDLTSSDTSTSSDIPISAAQMMRRATTSLSCPNVTTTTIFTTSTKTATAAISTKTTNIIIRTTITPTSTVTTPETYSYTFTEVSTVIEGTPPAVQLPSPTAIVGDIVNGSPSNYDDYFFQVDLPFPVTFYGQSNSTISVSTNGIIALGYPGSYSGYTNVPLPATADSGSSYIPDTSLLALWDDLFIYQGTQQGIYYEIDGIAPNRNLSIEFYTSKYREPAQFYHFLISYQESVPNTVQYRYFQISDNGNSATVGAQNRIVTTDPVTGETQTSYISSQYSYEQPVILPGLVLQYNIATNTFDVISAGSCG